MKGALVDLLLWRHAEAFDASDAQPEDLRRPLTPRGFKQALRMAQWLDQHMPEGVRILSSPALRCESTAAALKRKYKLCPELGPTSSASALLELAAWPDAKSPILIVGHQPTLGQTIALILGIGNLDLSVRKGSLWWIRHRVREGEGSAYVQCVQSPDML